MSEKPEIIFISYCRQELTFVDSLYQDLLPFKYPLWLDFHELRVGEDWTAGIQRGLDAAKTLLVVVSSASMKSDNVTFEWQTAIQEKKRIILVIFEAVALPYALKGYTQEWVDFRGDYDTALRQLAELLRSQITPAPYPPYPVPETGFAVPTGVMQLAQSVRRVGRLVWLVLLPLLLALIANSSEANLELWLGGAIAGAVIVAVGIYAYTSAKKIPQREYHFWYLLMLFVISFILIQLGIAWSQEAGTIADKQESIVLEVLAVISYIACGVSLYFIFLLPIRLSSRDVYRWSSPSTGFGTGLGADMFKMGLALIAIGLPLAIALILANLEIGILLLTSIWFLPSMLPAMMMLWWLTSRSIRHYRQYGKNTSVMPAESHPQPANLPVPYPQTVQVPSASPSATITQSTTPNADKGQLRICVVYEKHDEVVAYAIYQLVKQMNHVIVTSEFAQCVIILRSQANPSSLLEKARLYNGGEGVVFIPIILDNAKLESMPDDADYKSISATQAIVWKNGVNLNALKVMLQDVHDPQNRQYLPGQFPQRPRAAIPMVEQAQKVIVGQADRAILAIEKMRNPIQTLDPTRSRSLEECMRVFGTDDARLQAHRAGHVMPDETMLVYRQMVQVIGVGVVALVIGLLVSQLEGSLASIIALCALFTAGASVWAVIQLFNESHAVKMVLGGIRRSRKSSPRKQIYMVDCGVKQYSVKPDVWQRLWDEDVGLYQVYLVGDMVVDIEPAHPQ